MKKCCDQYIQQSQPKNPQASEFFYEIQKCSCGQRLRILFQRIQFLGGEVQYTAVSAEVL